MRLEDFLNQTSDLPRAGAIRKLYCLASEKEYHVVGTCDTCWILKEYGACQIKEACEEFTSGRPFGCNEWREDQE